MPDKEVLNTEEAAEFLGVSTFTIREYAKKGTIPCKKIGKEWRFYKPDLVAWVRGKAAPQEQAQDQ
jgi:excisionase family DNA binding protein